MDNVETWKELVKCRKAQSGASIPRNFAFLDHRYLLFLGIDASIELDNPISQLYYVDLSAYQSSSCVTSLDWKPLSATLLSSSDQLLEGDSKEKKDASKEEELLRERQRRSFEGLYSYSFHPLTQRLLVPQSTKLDVFVYCDSNSSSLKDAFQLLNSYRSSEGYLDAKWSPDGLYISFIRNRDIWLLSLRDNLEAPLTSSEKNVSCGVAEYVMQEEFDRFTGYWWSPSVIDMGNDMPYYCILYLEVDQSMVPLHQGTKWNTRMEVEEIHYPRVSDPNAVAEPRVLFVPQNTLFTVGSDEMRKSILKNWKPERSIHQQFPWAEYIVRAGWLTDDPFASQPSISANLESRKVSNLSYPWKNSYFWLALLDRSQQHLAIVLFDCTSHSGEGIVLWEERQPQWINVFDFILFLNDETELGVSSEHWISAIKYDDNIESTDALKSRACITCPRQRIDSKHLTNVPENIHFLIVSEVNGYAHLYYNQVRFQRWDSFIDCQLYYLPLTRNAVESDDSHSLSLITSIKYVDYRRGHIFFIGVCKSGLEKHLYVWKKPGIVQRLTDADINCTECCFKEDGSRLVIQWASLTQFPETYIMDQDDNWNWIPKWKIENRRIHPQFEFSIPRNPPVLFHFQVERDVKLYGCLYLPPQLQFDRTSATETLDIHSLSHYIQGGNEGYPLLLIVYGGPHVQLVSNDYRLTAQLKYQYLASQGIICMMLDNRGSFNRGHVFETPIYQKLGQLEVDDQIAALRIVLGQGFVNPKRTAVFGWSYGGYMSLMLFAKHSSLFRIAIAGAPVVNWEDYDSGYTERYMGLLSENAQRYSESSILHWINQVPDEEGRLILVHSLSDENVHPQHTFQLIDSLIQHGKPYTFYLFPRERHGLRDLSSQVYFEHYFGKTLCRL